MEVKALEPGDHIVVHRGLYNHHGIFCGNDKVIHYRSSLKTKWSAEICTTTLSEFGEGAEVYIVLDESSDPVEVIIRRAESRLGERWYNLLFNNCEHFATFCRTGTGESRQVKTAVGRVALTAGGRIAIANGPAIAGAVGRAVSGITAGTSLPSLSAITIPSLTLPSLPALGISALSLVPATLGISLLAVGLLSLALFVVSASQQESNGAS